MITVPGFGCQLFCCFCLMITDLLFLQRPQCPTTPSGLHIKPHNQAFLLLWNTTYYVCFYLNCNYS